MSLARPIRTEPVALHGRAIDNLRFIRETMAAGAMVTAAAYRAGRADLLPRTWLLLYDTAVATVGAYSLRLVPMRGLPIAGWYGG